VASQSNCFRHACAKLIPRNAAFKDESNSQKPLQQILRIVLWSKRLQKLQNLVFAVCATGHAPREERQFASLQFV